MSLRWRNVRGENGYRVSDDGRIKSFVNNRHGVGGEPHILKPDINKQGYETVCLGRGNRKLVHRLVAEAFIPNPNNLPIVRHMDDNPRNNRVENLAWGTQVDNMQDCVKHGRLVGDTRKAVESTKIPVRAISLDGTYEEEFPSMKEAARTLGVWPQHVTSVIQGKIKQTGGYRFELIELERGEYDANH